MTRLLVLLSVYMATPPAPYVKAVGSSLSLHGNSSSTICQGCWFFSQFTWQLTPAPYVKAVGSSLSLHGNSLQHHMSRLLVLLSVYMATHSSIICQGCWFFSLFTWQLLQHHMTRLLVLLSVYMATHSSTI